MTEPADIDATLGRIFTALLKRLETEIDSYTVPQLIMAADKVTAIQLRLRALRAHQEAANVGSTVRKYTAAFAAPNDPGRRKARTRRRDTDADIIGLALRSDDNEE